MKEADDTRAVDSNSQHNVAIHKNLSNSLLFNSIP